MKTTIYTLLLLLFSIGISAQTKKLDKIITKDYQVIEGTISKMSDQSVEYSLPNETMVISIDVSKLARIDFANGRSQTFLSNETNATQSDPIQSATKTENTIAVLPVPYINSDNLAESEEMSKFAQNDIYNKLIEKSSNIFPLTVQDLRTTNSLLYKAGIDYKNIDETPIADLHKILGTDNIIAAKVSYTTSENQTTTGYSSGDAKVNKNNKKVKTSETTVSNTNSTTQYFYHVYFDMYKNNTKIYTQTREPFFKLKDSWMESVQYLLKRSPIYTKKK